MLTPKILPRWRSGLPVLTCLLFHIHLSVVEGVGGQLFPRNYVGGGTYQVTIKTRVEITLLSSNAGYAAETNVVSAVLPTDMASDTAATAMPGPEPSPTTTTSERTLTPTFTSLMPSPTTMKTSPVPKPTLYYSPGVSTFSPSPSPSCSTTEATIPTIPTPNGGGGGGGSVTDEDLKLRLGLGIGLGIGIPLLTLMGVGCFLLWRLLGKTRLVEIQRAAAIAAADAEKQQQKKLSLDDDDDVAGTTGPGELMSTEFYEAEGASKKIRPAELGI